MSAKSEIQLDNLGLNIYCHTTSSLFIFVKVSVFKKGKDVKYVLHLILSIFLQVLQKKNSKGSESSYISKGRRRHYTALRVACFTGLSPTIGGGTTKMYTCIL